jgi:hypothetical protein
VERTESVPSLVGTGQRLGLALLSVFIPSGSHRLVSSWSQTAIQADGDGQVKQLKAKDLLVPVGSRRRHKVKVLTDEAGADSNSFTVPVARNRNKFIEEDGCVDQPISTASACFFYWVWYAPSDHGCDSPISHGHALQVTRVIRRLRRTAHN